MKKWRVRFYNGGDCGGYRDYFVDASSKADALALASKKLGRQWPKLIRATISRVIVELEEPAAIKE